MAKALNVPTSALYKACTLYVLGSIGYVGMLWYCLSPVSWQWVDAPVTDWKVKPRLISGIFQLSQSNLQPDGNYEPGGQIHLWKAGLKAHMLETERCWWFKKNHQHTAGCISCVLGSCVASHGPASCANEKACSEIISPPLIKAVWYEAVKRNWGRALDAVTLSIDVAEYPLQPVKALSTFFQGRMKM